MLRVNRSSKGKKNVTKKKSNTIRIITNIIVEEIKEIANISRNIISKRPAVVYVNIKKSLQKKRCGEEKPRRASGGKHRTLIGQIEGNVTGQRGKGRKRQLEFRKEDLYPCQLCIDGETVGSVSS